MVVTTQVVEEWGGVPMIPTRISTRDVHLGRAVDDNGEHLVNVEKGCSRTQPSGPHYWDHS